MRSRVVCDKHRSMGVKRARKPGMGFRVVERLVEAARDVGQAVRVWWLGRYGVGEVCIVIRHSLFEKTLDVEHREMGAHGPAFGIGRHLVASVQRGAKKAERVTEEGPVEVPNTPEELLGE